MTESRTTTIRHTLREWLRLIGWAVSHTEPRIGYPPARVTCFPDPTSSARAEDKSAGRLDAEVTRDERKHVR